MVRRPGLAHGVAAATAIMVLVGGSSRIAGADFVRGDFNSDGKVTFSDAFFITAFLFIGAAPSDCLLTGDADDDGNLNLTDAIKLLNFLVRGSAAPPSPFPAPGPDPTAGGQWDCNSYGGGSPIEDPAAKIEILDAVATGGADGKAVITVRISHSGVVAGYAGRILVDSSVIGNTVGTPKDLTGTLKGGYNAASLKNGRLDFGYLISLTGNGAAWFQPESDRDVLEITVCLVDGTPAGDYPLTLGAGELADEASGRAVTADLASGTLTVLDDVAAGAGCSDTAGCTSAPSPPAPNPLPDLNASFSLEDAFAHPGGTTEMPFIIRADADVQGYSFSADFDEEVLQAIEIVPGFKKADNGFQKFELNNKNVHPGNAGVDEGFLIGAMVFSFEDNCHNMPANKPNEAVRFKFKVNPDTEVLSTEVRFLDGGQGAGQPIENAVTAFGTKVTPDLATSFVFVNGFVNVQPDITTFIRGDSDGNETVELADAVHTLGYLFSGGEPPACFDAADSNDDGTLNIGDPVATLSFLFLGKGTVPPPYPDSGEDPTPDAMGCSFAR